MMMYCDIHLIGKLGNTLIMYIPNLLRHPSDGKAWKHFDSVYPKFAAEPCDVRLGLCSDGFTPYIQASTSSYSCCPIFVTPYNLPPEMCMTKSYMFLSCLIPGPTNPKKNRCILATTY